MSNDIHTTALKARMRAAGIDPAHFSPEELSLIAKQSGNNDFSQIPSSPSAVFRRIDFAAVVGEIADAAQACLDAVGPCSPVMQDAQQKAATAAAAELGGKLPEFREKIDGLLQKGKEKQNHLQGMIHTCHREVRRLVCQYTASTSGRREDSDALDKAISHCENVIQALTDAWENRGKEMEHLSALCESLIPALLGTAAPLFDPVREGPFSAADFRAAALALRNACTQLMNDKEEI